MSEPPTPQRERRYKTSRRGRSNLAEIGRSPSKLRINSAAPLWGNQACTVCYAPCCESLWRLSRALDGEGYGVAAAEAEGGDPALQVAPLQFVEERHQDAGTGRADGMAEGYRAAIYVYFFRIEFELAGHRDGGYSEGFI